AFGQATSSVGDELSLFATRLRPVGDAVENAGAIVQQDELAGDHLASRRIRELLSEVRARIDGQSVAGDSAANQREIDLAIQEVVSIAGRSVRLGGATNAEIQDANDDQIADVQVVSLMPNAQASFSGSVTQTATAARLQVSGDGGGQFASSASFAIKGNRGQASFAVSAGDSLAAVALRINADVSKTGVLAEANGDTLELSSVDTGSDAHVSLLQTSSNPASASGVNAGQIASFGIESIEPGESESISGQVDSEAGIAELRLTGQTGSLVSETADVLILGEYGSTTISIVQGETLSDVADRINAETVATGVAAAVDADELVLTSTNTGTEVFVQATVTSIEGETITVDSNASQVANFQVLSITPGNEVTLTGSVTQAAAAAALTLEGASGAVVADSATFTLTGDLGSANISIVKDESLADVADRINDQTASTGVTAEVSGDNLLLASSEVGSVATVSVALVDVTRYSDVSGVNSQQLSSLSVQVSPTVDELSISGTIDTAADVAELTYNGFLGAATSSGTFTLTGSLGSATISVNTLESLTSIRNEINSHTAETGVSATASGNTLTLQSTGVGSAAIIEVDVTAGAFNVDGGNGDGTANGADATATINGQSLVGTANDFTFSDSGGSFSFSAVAGFTGAIDAVTIDSYDGAFTVTGGNGDGTANGLDATATINGQSLTATGTTFDLVEGAAQFQFDVVDGFTGAIDPITVTSTLPELVFTGGDVNDLVTGTDGAATINGQSLTSSDGSYSLATGNGNYEIAFQEGFTGVFDAIAVAAGTSNLDVSGGNGNGRATGSDAQATINGDELQGDGSTFRVEQNGITAEIQFVAGFSGEFDEFTIQGRASTAPATSLRLNTSVRESLVDSLVGPLSQLVSGGNLAGDFEQTADALQLVDDAISSLDLFDQEAERVPSLSPQRRGDSSTAKHLSRALIASQLFQTQASLATTEPGSLVDVLANPSLAQRKNIAALLNFKSLI
ncbi:MAG: hypothetical protein KDA42_04900, partial [Planctomycetales bacterium]|nr:hypothetical protein [Planctomycetales bacterium]